MVLAIPSNNPNEVIDSASELITLVFPTRSRDPELATRQRLELATNQASGPRLPTG